MSKETQKPAKAATVQKAPPKSVKKRNGETVPFDSAKIKEAIRKAYSELGKLYYAERASAPEPAYADICQRITDAMARISYNNERIADIKAAGQITDEEADTVEAEAVCGEDAPSCCGTQSDAPCCCQDKDEPSCCCQDEDKPQE